MSTTFPIIQRVVILQVSCFKTHVFSQQPASLNMMWPLSLLYMVQFTDICVATRISAVRHGCLDVQIVACPQREMLQQGDLQLLQLQFRVLQDTGAKALHVDSHGSRPINA